MYFDNAATTQILPEVLDRFMESSLQFYGNPSALHEAGYQSGRALLQARKTLASLIKGKESNLFFTSGGTESNNLSLIGRLIQDKGQGHVLVSPLEHPSILKVIQSHFFNECTIEYVNVDDSGKIVLSDLIDKVRIDTVMFAISHVNGETGAVQPIEDIAREVKKKNKKTHIHFDCVQSFGKIPLDVSKVEADTFSFSAHKIHGPRGVGALYATNPQKLKPLLYGGDQEKGLRPGTENLPGIIAFARAAEIAEASCLENYDKVTQLKKSFLDQLLANVEEIRLISNDDCSPYIVSMAVKDIRGEVLVHHLEQQSIYISTGSACTSRKKNKQEFLKKMINDWRYEEGILRISFNSQHQDDEINQLVFCLSNDIHEIRKIIRGK